MRIYTVEIKEYGDEWARGLSFDKVDNAMSLYWYNISVGIECRIVDNKGDVIMEVDYEPEVFSADNDNKGVVL